MRAADGPAALTTRGAAIAPSEVVTPVTRPPARSIDVTRTPSTIFAPSSRARRAKPAVTSAGPARDATGRLARRARADRLARDDDDVAEPAPRKVVRDAAAHDTATDDHHAGRFRCGHRISTLAKRLIVSRLCSSNARAPPAQRGRVAQTGPDARRRPKRCARGVLRVRRARSRGRQRSRWACFSDPPASV